MKGCFSDSVKYFLKADKVMVQRVDDFYFITDGQSALKVPEYCYKAEFFTASGLFSELSNGEGLTIEPVRGESRKSDFNIAQFFKVENAQALTVSRLLLEIPKTSGKKSRYFPARFLYGSEFVTIIDEDKLKPFRGLCWDKVESCSQSSAVVFRGAMLDSEFLIMPIRLSDAIKEMLKQIGEKV